MNGSLVESLDLPAGACKRYNAFSKQPKLQKAMVIIADKQRQGLSSFRAKSKQAIKQAKD